MTQAQRSQLEQQKTYQLKQLCREQQWAGFSTAAGRKADLVDFILAKQAAQVSNGAAAASCTAFNGAALLAAPLQAAESATISSACTAPSDSDATASGQSCTAIPAAHVDASGAVPQPQRHHHHHHHHHNHTRPHRHRRHSHDESSSRKSSGSSSSSPQKGRGATDGQATHRRTSSGAGMSSSNRLHMHASGSGGSFSAAGQRATSPVGGHHSFGIGERSRSFSSLGQKDRDSPQYYSRSHTQTGCARSTSPAAARCGARDLMQQAQRQRQQQGQQVAPGRRLETITSGKRKPAAAQANARQLAELVHAEDIAKGFTSSWRRPATWFRRRVLDVFVAGHMTASRAELLNSLPTYAGIYLWLARAPHTRRWVPLYLGKAECIARRFEAYLHADGSFGPASEPYKYRVMVDLQRRGFAIQVRWRPVKSEDAKADESEKLAAFDFALNAAENQGYRDPQLPSGRTVQDYPIVHPAMDAVYQELSRAAAAAQQLCLQKLLQPATPPPTAAITATWAVAAAAAVGAEVAMPAPVLAAMVAQAAAVPLPAAAAAVP